MRTRLDACLRAVNEVLLGKEAQVRLAMACLLARGHLLVEDMPGMGKTTLSHALAKVLGLDFQRIQFTSDLLPGDILGTSVFDKDSGQFVFHPGPIFAELVLADEINRATPKSQSALLEAMEEGQVTIEGATRPLPEPFFVIATQNPQDFAGTFPLPESQLDRFLIRSRIGYAPQEVELRLLLTGETDTARDVTAVLDPTTIVTLQRETRRVTLESSLAGYLQAIVQATRTSPLVSLGASTRAAMALGSAARARAILRGRTYCIADDIQELTVPVLAHRIRLSSHADGFTPSREEAETALREIVARIPVPL